MVFVVDCGITVATILKFNERLKLMDEVAEKIHHISDEIGENIYENVTEALEKKDNFTEAHEEQILKIAEKKDEFTGNITEYSGRADLFEGMDIWGYEEFRSLQGTYPVISLSFAKLKNNSAAGIKEKSVKLTRKSNQILRSCWA